MNETKAHAEGVFQGKVLAFLDQWKEFSASWINHVAADDKNFKEIRGDLANFKAEIGRAAKADDLVSVRIAMTRLATISGLVGSGIGAIAASIIPLIIQQVIK
ncbi:MAG: hypothetical protein MN733_23620 [Nitrososphaera sp.]|nr:hypothetical protein [Nitrososphaera sp.]